MNSLDSNGKSRAVVQANRGKTEVGTPTMGQPFGWPGFMDGADPMGNSGVPSFTHLLNALRRRWPLALGLGFVGAVLGLGLVLLILPPKFTASVLVEVASKPDPLVLTESRQEDDFLMYKAKMQSLVKSPLILNAALYDPEIKDLAVVRQPQFVEWLEWNIKTDFLKGPEILKISLSMDKPDEAAQVVNAVARAFLKEIEQRDRKKRQEILDELLGNQQAEERKLQEKRLDLRTLEKRLGLEDSGTLKAKYDQALTDLTLIKKTALETRIKHLDAQEEFRAFQDKTQNFDKFVIHKEQIDEEFHKEPEALVWIQEKAKIQKKILDYQIGGLNPESLIQNEKKALEILEKQMEKHKEQMRPALEKKLRDKFYGEMIVAMDLLKDRIKFLAKQNEVLAAEVKKQEEIVKQVNPHHQPQTLDILARREAITQAESSLQKLNDKVQLWRMEPNMGSRVMLLLAAVEPTGRDWSRQGKIGAATSIGLFALFLFGVGFWELRNHRISSTEEVILGLGLDVVGTVPAIPEHYRRPGHNGSSGKDLYWQSQLSEAVDSIRTMLLHVSRKEDIKVVMITSAQGGEGKTSLASQLAASLARVWRKTLLIDGDLRKPSVHSLFELPQEPGLSEWLRGEIQPEDAIKPTLLSRLWMLPAGNWDSHAVQALAQDRVQQFFKDLKTQYDFIVVDSSPILPVADTLLFAQNMDAVLLAILRDVSRMPAVHAAQEKLNHLGVRCLGAVVLGANDHSGYSGYGYPTKTK